MWGRLEVRGSIRYMNALCACLLATNVLNGGALCSLLLSDPRCMPPQVNKVAGNFHFAPGRSYQQGGMHVHDIAPFGDALLDFTHSINKLSFGKPYPGMKNPLDGVRVKRPAVGPQGQITGMYQAGRFLSHHSWECHGQDTLSGYPRT